MGYLIVAFLGAKKMAHLLRNPCVLGCPRQRGEEQNLLPHPALSGARKWAELLCNPCVLGWR